MPLAQLAVARGVPYAQVDDLLRRALVQAAAQAHPQLPEHRKVSRISTVTGIHRREVTRLRQDAPDKAVAPRSPASELYAHWRAQPPYRMANGKSRVLPRTGAAPSFETLAQAVTRDVHPRGLLDELLRLGLAALDPRTDRVSLLGDGFVPQGDQPRLLGLLADNVGDHLSAAVANVLGDGHRHFEQAVFADGLTAQSLAEWRGLVAPLWNQLLAALVPPLERLVQRDRQAAQAVHRVRLGLYTYEEPPATPAAAAPVAPRRRLTRKTAKP